MPLVHHGIVAATDDDGDETSARVCAEDVKNMMNARVRSSRNAPARNLNAGRRGGRTGNGGDCALPQYHMVGGGDDDDDDDDASENDTDEDSDDHSCAPTSRGDPVTVTATADDDMRQIRTVDTSDLFVTPHVADATTTTTTTAHNDGPTHSTTDRDEVPVPWHTSASRGVKNAFQMRDDDVRSAVSMSGANALKRLYTVRYGAKARNMGCSLVAKENQHTIDSQAEMFDAGIKSISSGLNDDDDDDDAQNLHNHNPSSVQMPEDVTRAELISAILREKNKSATESTVRTSGVLREVPVRRRVTEEMHLRAAVDGERDCARGPRCQGNFVCDDGFTVMEYDSRARLLAHEDVGLCVLCSRLDEQKRFTQSASNNAAYADNMHPDLTPRYQNLVGVNDYCASQVYTFSSNDISALVHMVVIFSNLHFSRGYTRLSDGQCVPCYFQSVGKPLASGFRVGRT